jgi:hypothetical protein
MDFHENWYGELWKYVEKPKIWLKLDKNTGCFSCRPKHILVLLVSSFCHKNILCAAFNIVLLTVNCTSSLHTLHCCVSIAAIVMWMCCFVMLHVHCLSRQLRPIHTLRAMSMLFPCRATKGLECVFPIWFTQCGRVWFTLAMLRPCHALTMPFFSRPRHSTAVERWPVSYLPAFGFSRLPRGVPRRLSEAYQSSSQQSIPTTVKSGSSTLQKGQSVKLLG